MAEKNTNTTIAQNKKALHDYFVIESFEAGIELVGTEVKSLRQGKCNLKTKPFCHFHCQTPIKLTISQVNHPKGP